MPEIIAQYLDKWLKQSTAKGLNNPVVKMPVKRFRPLQPMEFNSIVNGGTLIIGTMSDPIARNLYKNFQTRIRERGEHCAFICSGSVEMAVAGGVGLHPRTALFPVCLKRADLRASGEQIKVTEIGLLCRQSAVGQFRKLRHTVTPLPQGKSERILQDVRL